jgi:hypothetical protein
MLFFKRFTPASAAIQTPLLPKALFTANVSDMESNNKPGGDEAKAIGEFSFAGGFYVPLTYTVSALVRQMLNAGLIGTDADATDRMLLTTTLFEEVRLERVDRLFAAALQDDPEVMIGDLGLDHGDVIIYTSEAQEPRKQPPATGVAVGDSPRNGAGVGRTGSSPVSSYRGSGQQRLLPDNSRGLHDHIELQLMERRRRSTAQYADPTLSVDLAAFQLSPAAPPEGIAAAAADSPRVLSTPPLFSDVPVVAPSGHTLVVDADGSSSGHSFGKFGNFSPRHGNDDDGDQTSAATTAPPTPRGITLQQLQSPAPLGLSLALDCGGAGSAGTSPETAAVTILEDGDRALDRIGTLHRAISAALLSGASSVIIALQMLSPVLPAANAASWSARSTQLHDTFFVLADLSDSFAVFHKRCTTLLSVVCNAPIDLSFRYWPTWFSLQDLPSVGSAPVNEERCGRLFARYKEFLKSVDAGAAGTQRCGASFMTMAYPSELSLLLQLACIRSESDAPSGGIASSAGLLAAPGAPAAVFQVNDSLVLNETIRSVESSPQLKPTAAPHKQEASSPAPVVFTAANASAPFYLCSTFRLLAESVIEARDGHRPGSSTGDLLDVQCRWVGWARARPLTSLHLTMPPDASVGVLLALLARKVGHHRPFSLSCVPSGMPSTRCAHLHHFWPELFISAMNPKTGFIEVLALVGEVAKSASRTAEWWVSFFNRPSTSTAGTGGNDQQHPAAAASHGSNMIVSFGILPNADRNVSAAMRHPSLPVAAMGPRRSSTSSEAASNSLAQVCATPQNALRFFIVCHVQSTGKGPSLLRQGCLDTSHVLAKPALVPCSDGLSGVTAWVKQFYPGNDDGAERWTMLVEVTASQDGPPITAVDGRVVLVAGLPRPRVLRTVSEVDDETANSPAPLSLGGAFIPVASFESEEEYMAMLRPPTSRSHQTLHIPAPARLIIVHDAESAGRLYV